jgi:hypothetical protein
VGPGRYIFFDELLRPGKGPNSGNCSDSLTSMADQNRSTIRGSRDTPGRVSELSHGPARGQGLVQPLF